MVPLSSELPPIAWPCAPLVVEPTTINSLICHLPAWTAIFVNFIIAFANFFIATYVLWCSYDNSSL